MTHLDDENGCCNWATSAAAKGSARVPLVHEKAPLIGGAFSLFVPPPSGGGDFLFSSFTAVHSFLQLQSKYCELDQG
jgi:hypothetical protein